MASVERAMKRGEASRPSVPQPRLGASCQQQAACLLQREPGKTKGRQPGVGPGATRSELSKMAIENNYCQQEEAEGYSVASGVAGALFFEFAAKRCESPSLPTKQVGAKTAQSQRELIGCISEH